MGMNCAENQKRRISCRVVRCLLPFDWSLEITLVVACAVEDTRSIARGIEQGVTEMNQRVLDMDLKETLARLPVVPDAAFDSRAEEHSAFCLEGTRVKLLNDIAEWIQAPDAEAIFWLNGMAGTGKSTITRTLALSASKDRFLGANFFFKRGESDRGGVSKLATTLAFQLATTLPGLAAHIKCAIDDDPAISGKTLREQFDKLIFAPLSSLVQASRPSKPLLILIDALDECEHDADVRLVISLFSRVRSLPMPVRVFVTSRPDLPVRLGFRDIKRYQYLVLHEIPEPVIEHDLSIYFQNELQKLRNDYNKCVPAYRQLQSGWPDLSQQKILVEMAVPLFIFAATVCRFLADHKTGPPNWKLQTVLKYRSRSQESKLDSTYLPVLNQMVVGLSVDETHKALGEFRYIVGSIVILESPLSICALANLLDKPQALIEHRLDMLHSVLSVPLLPTQPVRLLHLSFRDFLVDPRKEGRHRFRVDEKGAHQQLASSCIRIMNASLRQDICSLTDPGTLVSTVAEQRIKETLPAELQYACRFWPYHLQKAGASISDHDEAHKFLLNHFLHWLEALSLVKRLKESLRMVQTLQDLLQVSKYPKGARHLAKFFIGKC
jgi:hypothetical protein